MLAIIDHLQAINRSLLNRLRPMALGDVPLGDLLSEMVARPCAATQGFACYVHAGRN